MIGPWTKLSTEELMLLNCGVGEDSWESLGPQGDPTSPSYSPSVNQSWLFIGKTDAEDETPKLWPLDAKNWLIRKDPDAGKDWRWEEKGTTEDEMLGWQHWLNGVWVNSGSWWWTRRPGVLQSMGSQRVGLDWATGLNWTQLRQFLDLAWHTCDASPSASLKMCYILVQFSSSVS